ADRQQQSSVHVVAFSVLAPTDVPPPSLHDALPIWLRAPPPPRPSTGCRGTHQRGSVRLLLKGRELREFQRSDAARQCKTPATGHDATQPQWVAHAPPTSCCSHAAFTCREAARALG